MAKTSKKPLEQLEALLPKMTNDELLELIVCAFEEGARRADNYAALLEEEAEPPVDVLNEGFAFAVRLEQLIPTLGGPKRAGTAWYTTHEALNDLRAPSETRAAILGA